MSQEIIIRSPVQVEYACNLIRKLSSEKLWSVTVKQYSQKRTLDQNAIFHKWVEIIANRTGNDFEDTKEALKSMFLPPRYVTIDDKTIEVRRSTAALRKNEMSDFLNRVSAWFATDFGEMLPNRDDFRDRT